MRPSSSLLSALAILLTLSLSACDFAGADSEPDVGAGAPEAPAAGPDTFDAAKISGEGPVLYRNDLELESPTCWGARNSSGYATAACGEWVSMGSWGAKLAVNGVRRSGAKAMSFTFSKNEDVAGAGLTLSADVVNVRAWYYFAPGFDFGQGVKVARISSFNETTQVNDIDIVLTVRSRGGADQCGLTDMNDMGMFFNGRPVGYDWGNITSTRTFTRGRWYAIEYQVFLNTPGMKDGSVTLWVDGVQVAKKSGINIRGAGGSSVKLNRIRVGGWYSNSANGNYSCANPAQPSTLYVDDVAVGARYIGPN